MECAHLYTSSHIIVDADDGCRVIVAAVPAGGDVPMRPAANSRRSRSGSVRMKSRSNSAMLPTCVVVFAKAREGAKRRRSVLAGPAS